MIKYSTKNTGREIKVKTVNQYWFNGMFGTIGIVTGEDEVTGKRKAYIAPVPGMSEEADVRRIKEAGAPVDPRQIADILADLSEKK